MCLMKIFPVLKVFISSKNLSFICYARLCAGYFYIKSSPKENFPIKQKKIRKNSDFIEFIRISKKNINFFLLYFIFAQLKVVFHFFIVVFAYIFVLLL